MGVFKKGKNWGIDYYIHGRRKREIIGPSKSLAENTLRKRQVEIAENRYLDVKKQYKIKFEDFAKQYLELHSKPNNKSWKKSDWPNIVILKRYFSGRYLYEINKEDIEKFKADRIKEVTPSRINRNLSCLKSIFNRAIEWGKVEDNPVSNVRMLKDDTKRLRYLEKEEIIRLLTNCRSHLHPIVIVALNTGMRRGEILSLRWQDIDFKRGIIYILNTKNGEKREIPINEAVKTALIRAPRNPNGPYVFCHKDGKPINDIKKTFWTAMKKAGIIGFRFHDLRHTFASYLVMSGVDLNTVRELLGHKSLEMTLRYSHLSQDHKKRAVDVLNKQMDTIWSMKSLQEKTSSVIPSVV
jgi:integrase